MAKKKKIVPPPPRVLPSKFYVHYDFETGNIVSVSNEKLEMHTHSLEITFEEYEKFVVNEYKISDFKVENDILICTKIDPEPKVHRLLQEVDMHRLKFYKGSNEWTFITKNQLSNMTVFLTVEHDRNQLIKTFNLNFKEL